MTNHDVSNLLTFAVGFLLTAVWIVIAMLRKQRRDSGEWPRQWAEFAFGMAGMLIMFVPLLVAGGFAAVIVRMIVRWVVARP